MLLVFLLNQPNFQHYQVRCPSITNKESQNTEENLKALKGFSAHTKYNNQAQTVNSNER